MVGRWRWWWSKNVKYSYRKYCNAVKMLCTSISWHECDSESQQESPTISLFSSEKRKRSSWKKKMTKPTRASFTYTFFALLASFKKEMLSRGFSFYTNKQRWLSECMKVWNPENTIFFKHLFFRWALILMKIEYPNQKILLLNIIFE